MSKNIFVTGIGTDVGKTVVSAILVEALQADYWKPIQCGADPITNKIDSQIVKELVSNNKTKIHTETYYFKNAKSPDAAAKMENVEIDLDKIKAPASENGIIIEGAGGIMVPLNNKHLVVDLIEKLHAEVILVSQTYLGSINHTLLTCAELKRRNINVIGIIFNGTMNLDSENSILNFSGYKLLSRIPNEEVFTKSTITSYAQTIKSQFLNPKS